MGKVTVDEKVCKGCGLCVTFCTRQVLKLNEDVITAKGYHPAYMAQPEKCTGCACCALMCPDSALTVER